MTKLNTKSDALMADLRRAYRDEYEASDALKAEFQSAADYAAYQIRLNSGSVKIMCDNVEANENEAAARRAAKSYRFSSDH